MKEQTWKRKEYETWDDAFRALAPVIRQQSVRVASYTQVLFVQACASSFGTQTVDGAERMKGKYADLAYKCGMYHQLGKALVPPEYQIYQGDFTAEEEEVYKKYTTDGRVLVANLQEKSLRAKEKRSGSFFEMENIPWMMIREACQQHMERWDGTGYPDGRSGDEISPIAQIVGLAKELDRLASETKSENPFSEAYDAILAQAGTAFSPELVKVLMACRTRCRAVYTKYVHYTMTLPKTIPLVEKKKDRPMGLSYRPMLSPEGKVNAYEAIPWFAGIADNPSERESVDAIEPQLRRLDLVSALSTYFLYEAADTLLRIENCKLSATVDSVVLEMIPSFYTGASKLSVFEQLFEHQPIDRSRLILTAPASILAENNAEQEEAFKLYAENGVMLMADAWNPETLSLERLKELGIRYVRLDPEFYLKRESADALSALPAQGITAYARDVDSEDAFRWLIACGVKHFVGATTGQLIDEDELIREALLREREDA